MRFPPSPFSSFARNSDVPDRAIVPKLALRDSLFIPSPESAAQEAEYQRRPASTAWALVALFSRSCSSPRMMIRPPAVSAMTETFRSGAVATKDASVRDSRRTFSSASFELETAG